MMAGRPVSTSPDSWTGKTIINWIRPPEMAGDAIGREPETVDRRC
jgi:hypothetical protein